MGIKLSKKKIAGIAAILCVLAAAFVWGGNYGSNTSVNGDKEKEESQVQPVEQQMKADSMEAESGEDGIPPGEEVGGEERVTPSVPRDVHEELSPTDKAIDVQSQISEGLNCILSISCATVLDNMEILTKGKEEIIPGKGILLEPEKVTFYKGESVFNVLSREVRKNKIHMEFVKTPAYNSIYIEGIGNLYEFDCGELSGWMYRVNGEFPGYSSSKYILNDGDVIEWVYSCDWGRDVGAPRGGRQE
ncbi:MAG: DUF4430 domain-containing protein [Anaerovoracaceae bacterium]